MRGQFRFVDFAGDRSGDDGGRIFVPDVILHDEDGADSALFTPYDGGEIRIIQFSSFDIHITPLLKNEHSLIAVYVKGHVCVPICYISIDEEGVSYT